MEKTLLPSGFYDLLPPQARQETALINHCLEQFAAQGYEQVALPLLEFEETLLAGRGDSLTNQIFRVMDPLSNRMMGFRADMTLQIARVATSRLGDAPRPLRLSYAGPVVQIAAEKLRTERQLTQVGAELFGSADPAADAEIILLAATTLQTMGVPRLTVDLNLPEMVSLLIEKESLSPELRSAVYDAITRKDASRLVMLSDATRALLDALMSCAGPAGSAIAAMKKLAFPPAAQSLLGTLEAVVKILQSQQPSLQVTVDALEKPTFEYHSGVSFSIFAQGVKNEIGRGGRYGVTNTKGDVETATGFTLYLHILQDSLPLPPQPRRVYLPYNTPATEAEGVRKQGDVTLQGLDPKADARAEAKRLGCGFILDGGAVKTV